MLRRSFHLFSKSSYNIKNIPLFYSLTSSSFNFIQKYNYCSNIFNEFQPKLSVIGVGGGGSNAVNHMITTGMKGVDFIVCNTDVQALQQTLTENRIRLGKELTKGLGAGAKPEIGQQAAEQDLQQILELPTIKDANMVFIAAGMGGGTGTGAAPVIAKALQEKGILTVGVVTCPFNFEGPVRSRHALQGLSKLQDSVDTLIVIQNQRLVEIAMEEKNFSFNDAFKTADDVLAKGVRTITDLIVNPGLVNLDFGDVKTVLLSSKVSGKVGRSLMGTATATGDNRAIEAAMKATTNRLLDNQSLHGARGLLINITGGQDLSLIEIEEAANIIQEQAHPDAEIVWGAANDDSLNGKISVSVVACGLGMDD